MVLVLLVCVGRAHTLDPSATLPQNSSTGGPLSCLPFLQVIGNPKLSQVHLPQLANSGGHFNVADNGILDMLDVGALGTVDGDVWIKGAAIDALVVPMLTSTGGKIHVRAWRPSARS